MCKSGTPPDFDFDADAARTMSMGPKYVAAGLAIEVDYAWKLCEGQNTVVPPRAPSYAPLRDQRLAPSALRGRRGVIPAGARRVTNAVGEAAVRAVFAPAIGGSADPDPDIEDVSDDESGSETDEDDVDGGEQQGDAGAERRGLFSKFEKVTPPHLKWFFGVI